MQVGKEIAVPTVLSACWLIGWKWSNRVDKIPVLLDDARFTAVYYGIDCIIRGQNVPIEPIKVCDTRFLLIYCF